MTTLVHNLIAKLRFKLIVLKADAMHATTGKRYYVIPHPHSKHKLLVCNRKEIIHWRKLGAVKKNITHLEIMEFCLYYTNSGGKTTGRMTDTIRTKNENDYVKWAKKQ